MQEATRVRQLMHGLECDLYAKQNLSTLAELVCGLHNLDLYASALEGHGGEELDAEALQRAFHDALKIAYDMCKSTQDSVKLPEQELAYRFLSKATEQMKKCESGPLKASYTYFSTKVQELKSN